MQWEPDPKNNDMYQFIKTWINLRKQHPALANHGSWEWIHDELIAFKRSDSKEVLHFYYNPTDSPIHADVPKGKVLFGKEGNTINLGDILLIKTNS